MEPCKCDLCGDDVRDGGYYFTTGPAVVYDHLCERCVSELIVGLDDPGWQYADWLTVFAWSDALPGVYCEAVV